MELNKVALGFGSNLGERLKNISEAMKLLESAGLKEWRQSKIMSSSPVDCPEGSGEFLNGVVVGFWTGTCRELLKICQEIEIELGRATVREVNSPRPIDLDILLFAGEAHEEPDLMVPHPRLHLRDFVLLPLNELEPNWRVPRFNKSVKDLLKQL